MKDEQISDGLVVVRYCANEECKVRIRERVGLRGAETCKWCQEKMREAQK